MIHFLVNKGVYFVCASSFPGAFYINMCVYCIRIIETCNINTKISQLIGTKKIYINNIWKLKRPPTYLAFLSPFLYYVEISLSAAEKKRKKNRGRRFFPSFLILMMFVAKTTIERGKSITWSWNVRESQSLEWYWVHRVVLLSLKT